MGTSYPEENRVKIPRALRICSWVVSLLTVVLAIMSMFAVGLSAFNAFVAFAGCLQLLGLYTRNGELLVLKVVGVELFMLGLLIWPFMFPPPESIDWPSSLVRSADSNTRIMIGISWCCAIWWVAAKCLRTGKLGAD